MAGALGMVPNVWTGITLRGGIISAHGPEAVTWAFSVLRVTPERAVPPPVLDTFRRVRGDTL